MLENGLCNKQSSNTLTFSKIVARLTPRLTVTFNSLSGRLNGAVVSLPVLKLFMELWSNSNAEVSSTNIFCEYPFYP